MTQQHFLVNKNDLSDTRWHSTPMPTATELSAGQVLIAVDHFALTANNITYAVAGERMQYWQFFPTEPGWGQVPVWGYGTVVHSAHPDVAVGERYYGYFPIASHLTVQADKVSERGFVDNVSHRQELAAVYNQYQRVQGASDSDTEAAQMLYRPLFMTSFMLDDYLADNDFFGAEAVLLTSASSKTALGLAALLHARGAPQVVGLTSARNEGFVNGLGCYHQVVTYDRVASLDATRPSVVVDMAGNGDTLAAVHNHYDTALKQSILVGATHWDARAGAQAMAGPKPELFFAPAHIARRTKEWGPGGLEERFSGAWERFTNAVGDWITVQQGIGEAAIGQAYALQLQGDAPASTGYILRF